MQRVTRAAVRVEDREVSVIGHGLCLLVGVEVDDERRDVVAAVDKITGLRIFADDEGKLNRSLVDVGGEVLVVSQFTLLGDVRKGRRPSFTRAAGAAVAQPLVAAMVEVFREAGVRVGQGVFGAKMTVDIVNDGPVTLLIEVRDGRIC